MNIKTTYSSHNKPIYRLITGDLKITKNCVPRVRIRRKRGRWSCFLLDWHKNPRFLCNSGKLLLLPYTKGFGRITHFLGNDLATVLYTAFCLDLLFKQLVGYKCTKDIGTIIQKREKASTLL